MSRILAGLRLGVRDFGFGLMYICIKKYTHVHEDICIYTYVYICINVFTLYTSIYIYRYVHLYIHIYIHIEGLGFRDKGRA